MQTYTYIKLQTANGEVWTAVGKTTVKKGDNVTVENATVMHNFQSKGLKQNFSTIYFGNLAGTAAGQKADAAAAHGSGSRLEDTANIRVPKATAANAKTVEEVIANRAALKDQTVVIRAKVVKFSPDIMGKNWVHLQDGTGNATDKTNDLLMTTSGFAKAGDVVTVSGVVKTDKDFGAGYSYKVLLEQGEIQK